MTTVFIVKTPDPKPKTHPTDNLPVVSFYYPRITGKWDGDPRKVKVISATKTHITGLEILPDGKHQFKMFRRDRITGPGPALLWFTPNAHNPKH